MRMRVRVAASEGAFRISAFGMALEIDHVEGQNEIVMSKGNDGFATVELRDLSEVSAEVESAVSDDAVVTREVSEVASAVPDDAVVTREVSEVISAVADDAVSAVPDDAVATEVVPDVPGEALSEGSEELFARLSELRRQLAKEQGKPPYIIFHDSTLLTMARELPRDLKSLSKIDGVGRVKLGRYGDLFLEIILAHDGKKMAG